MISINNLSVEFSSQLLFDNINYVINPKDKIALVGKNGAGKSTMLKIIAGLQQPSGGSVAVPSDVTIGYLPQQMILEDTLTVLEEVRKVFAHVDAMHRKLDRLTEELAARSDYESAEYHALIEKMSTLSEDVAMAASDNFEADMERTLLGLGFVRSDFDRPTSEFSGGWRMRIELAKLLLQRPDVLLLDEPTNHLDLSLLPISEPTRLGMRSDAVFCLKKQGG
ncbi:MAG: ATP-binding cassette domain-containing protein, partial [Muribaculaceae bacterium]|nr:ATP-binding cassette domain-containing protein [Muribaculaceae bacterium]